MSSGRFKKIKIDDEFAFNNNHKTSGEFTVETFNLCCLFWQTFHEYDQKIRNERFNYGSFEFIIFQLNIYIQQHNLAHYELYRAPSSEATNNNNNNSSSSYSSSSSSKKRILIDYESNSSIQSFGAELSNSMLTTTAANIDANIVHSNNNSSNNNNNKINNASFNLAALSNLNFGNFGNTSSIFSVSMIYGDKKSNNNKLHHHLDDQHIVINFGSFEYPRLDSKNGSNSGEFTAVNNQSSVIESPDTFQFDDKIRVAEIQPKQPILQPSFREISDDDDDENIDDDNNDADDEEEDDGDDDRDNGKNENMKNKTSLKSRSEPNVRIIKVISDYSKEIKQSIHMFHLAKQQYLKMLENNDTTSHFNCNHICHKHCHHYSFANLRTLYKLKELFVNHANDMLKMSKSVKYIPK